MKIFLDSRNQIGKILQEKSRKYGILKVKKEKNTPFDPKMQKDKIQPNEEIKTETDENNKQPETVEKNAVGTDIVSENFTNPQKNKISENKDITNEDIQLDVTNKNDYESKINY